MCDFGVRFRGGFVVGGEILNWAIRPGREPCPDGSSFAFGWHPNARHVWHRAAKLGAVDDEDDFIFMTHAPGSLDAEVQQVKEEIRREKEAEREAPREEGRHGPPRVRRHGPARAPSPSGPASRPGRGESGASRESGPVGRPSGGARHSGPPSGQVRRETPIVRSPEPASTPEGPAPGPPRGATQRLLAGGRAFTERLKVRGQRATLRFHASKQELSETANFEALKRTFRALRKRRPTSAIAGSDVPDVLRDRSAPAPRPGGPKGLASSFPVQYVLGVLRGLHPSVLLGSLMFGLLLGAVLYFLAWTPAIGLVALGVGGSRLLAWRVRLVNDVSRHEDAGTWPNWEQVPASVTVYLGLALLFLPALVTSVASLGSQATQPAAWDPREPDSYLGRARVQIGGGGSSGREFMGAVADAAEVYADRAWDLQDSVDAERAAQGVTHVDEETERRRAQAEEAVAALRKLAGEAVEVEERPWREVMHDQADSLWAFANEPWTTSRALLVAALALFPMGLLVSARLNTAYAVLNPPLLLLSILRTPFSYPFVVAAFLAADSFLVGLVWIVPPTLTAAMGPSFGPGVSALVIGVLAIWACTLSGGILGRFYRSRRDALGW